MNVLEVLLNESTRSIVGEIRSRLCRLYEHLLKYEYMPTYQTRSWINTIKEQSSRLSELVKSSKPAYNLVMDGELDKDEYITAAANVLKDSRSNIVGQIPKTLPESMRLNKVMDPVFIQRFLKQHLYNTNLEKFI